MVPRRPDRVLPIVVATFGCMIAAPSAQAAVVNCGDVITASTRVDNDLVGCPGPNALVVTGTGVKLDLNGKELIGAGPGTGILVDAASSGTTITNGRVSGFVTGVMVEGPTTSLTSLGVDRNSASGVFSRSTATSVLDSYFDRNGT